VATDPAVQPELAVIEPAVQPELAVIEPAVQPESVVATDPAVQPELAVIEPAVETTASDEKSVFTKVSDGVKATATTVTGGVKATATTVTGGVKQGVKTVTDLVIPTPAATTSEPAVVTEPAVQPESVVATDPAVRPELAVIEPAVATAASDEKSIVTKVSDGVKATATAVTDGVKSTGTTVTGGVKKGVKAVTDLITNEKSAVATEPASNTMSSDEVASYFIWEKIFTDNIDVHEVEIGEVPDLGTGLAGVLNDAVTQITPATTEDAGSAGETASQKKGIIEIVTDEVKKDVTKVKEIVKPATTKDEPASSEI